MRRRPPPPQPPPGVISLDCYRDALLERPALLAEGAELLYRLPTARLPRALLILRAILME